MINPRIHTRRVGDRAPVLPESGGGAGRRRDRISSTPRSLHGLATQNNMRLAISQMPPGSILIAWHGTAPRRTTGGALHFVHDFSLYLRAPSRIPTSSYEDLFGWLVSAVPTGAHVVIAAALPDRSRLLADGSRSSIGAAQHSRDQRGRGDLRLLRSAGDASRARQSRRGMRKQSHGD